MASFLLWYVQIGINFCFSLIWILFFLQESFCVEVQGLLDKLFRLVETDPELAKQWSSLYVTFCKVG